MTCSGKEPPMIRLPILILLGTLLLPSSLAFGQTAEDTKAKGFPAYAVTGDQSGQTVDFVAARKDEPTLYAFVQAEKWDRPLARLLRTIDEELPAIDGAENLQIIAVWLTDDRTASKEYLPRARPPCNSARPPSPSSRGTASALKGGRSTARTRSPWFWSRTARSSRARATGSSTRPMPPRCSRRSRMWSRNLEAVTAMA